METEACCVGRSSFSHAQSPLGSQPLPAPRQRGLRGLNTMDRPGHENDRAFYCEAWNGTGAYTYDRIGRGTLHIRAACLSVLGGIQPGPLERYLRAVFAGRGDDGLLQRFQLAVWPDGGGPWRNVDRWPNSEARTRVTEVFQRLTTLERSPRPAGACRETPGRRWTGPRLVVGVLEGQGIRRETS